MSWVPAGSAQSQKFPKSSLSLLLQSSLWLRLGFLGLQLCLDGPPLWLHQSHPFFWSHHCGQAHLLHPGLPVPLLHLGHACLWLHGPPGLQCHCGSSASWFRFTQSESWIHLDSSLHRLRHKMILILLQKPLPPASVGGFNVIVKFSSISMVFRHCFACVLVHSFVVMVSD